MATSWFLQKEKKRKKETRKSHMSALHDDQVQICRNCRRYWKVLLLTSSLSIWLPTSVTIRWPLTSKDTVCSFSPSQGLWRGEHHGSPADGEHPGPGGGLWRGSGHELPQGSRRRSGLWCDQSHGWDQADMLSQEQGPIRDCIQVE